MYYDERLTVLPNSPVGAPLVGALVDPPPTWELPETLYPSQTDNTAGLRIPTQTNVNQSCSMASEIVQPPTLYYCLNPLVFAGPLLSHVQIPTLSSPDGSKSG